MTPHQRRMRELEASRRLQTELQDLIDAHPGTVPSVAVAEAFERCGSLLPAESDLLQATRAPGPRLAEPVRGAHRRGVDPSRDRDVA